MSQFLIAFLSFHALMVEMTSSAVDGEKKIEFFTPICGVVYDETLSIESIFSAISTPTLTKKSLNVFAISCGSAIRFPSLVFKLVGVEEERFFAIYNLVNSFP